MPDKRLTLTRFPVFGLFAYRAAKKLDYPEGACPAPRSVASASRGRRAT